MINSTQILPNPNSVTHPDTNVLRILLAEDNSINQIVALSLLKRLGHTGKAVANGCEALEALNESDFNVLLLDGHMPKLDGFEVTRQIRLKEKGTSKHIYIIALTGSTFDEDKTKCLNVGMDDYLAKPVMKDGLDNALKKAALFIKANSNPSNPSLDHKIIAGLKELQTSEDPSLITELIDLFEADAANNISEIQMAIEQNDSRQLEKLAHSLKGGAISIGANRLSKICHELETMGKMNQACMASQTFQLMKNEFENVVKELQAEKHVEVEFSDSMQNAA